MKGKIRCKLCGDILDPNIIKGEMFFCKCGQLGLDVTKEYYRVVGTLVEEV